MVSPKKEKSIFVDLNKIAADATPEQFNKLVDLLKISQIMQKQRNK